MEAEDPCPHSLTTPYLIPYGMASQQLQLAAQAPCASFRKTRLGLQLRRQGQGIQLPIPAAFLSGLDVDRVTRRSSSSFGALSLLLLVTALFRGRKVEQIRQRNCVKH